MDACDVLIVGAGPAGTSCAWKLRQSGLNTVLLDKQVFPRDKVCGGWITPAVVEELEMDLADYARHRVLQPISGFRTSRIGSREIETQYGKPVSYGIRRCEFDDFLLRRCGARMVEGTPLKSLQRSRDSWIANDQFKARLVIGAGGHFCPVARFRGANARSEIAVTAQEVEFEMTPEQARECRIKAEMPELYFCADMKGYGWCVKKRNFLNVGLGRLDPHALPKFVATFMEFLRRTGKVAFTVPGKLLGHSYLLYGRAHRNVADDAILLIGDAAGMAYAQSGEGIRPAIESGLLAARAILEHGLENTSRICQTYRESLEQRFGEARREWVGKLGRYIPSPMLALVSRLALTNAWFSRNVLLDRWFLHREQSALHV